MYKFILFKIHIYVFIYEDGQSLLYNFSYNSTDVQCKVLQCGPFIIKRLMFTSGLTGRGGVLGGFFFLMEELRRSFHFSIYTAV